MNLANISSLFTVAKLGRQAFDFLTSSNDKTSFADVLNTHASQATAAGRNVGLQNPEAAYKMMTQINNFAADFKAQFAELSQMGATVEKLEETGRELSIIDPSSSNEEIRDRLQGFVDQYNAWIARFSPTVKDGGSLDDVQAAEVSLHELEQSVRSIFNGAASGIRGLADLGIQIDPASKQASLDVGRLEAMLATDKAAAVTAIDEFSAHFAKSADLLNAQDNFIPRALDNRGRAMQFIADNLKSWQGEFGTGDPARSTNAYVAQALNNYQSIYAMGKPLV